MLKRLKMWWRVVQDERQVECDAGWIPIPMMIWVPIVCAFALAIFGLIFAVQTALGGIGGWSTADDLNFKHRMSALQALAAIHDGSVNALGEAIHQAAEHPAADDATICGTATQQFSATIPGHLTADQEKAIASELNKALAAGIRIGRQAQQPVLIDGEGPPAPSPAEHPAPAQLFQQRRLRPRSAPPAPPVEPLPPPVQFEELKAVTAAGEFSEPNMFRWATVTGVHDGDGPYLAVEIDKELGNIIAEAKPARLVGIQAPELSTAKGPASRDHLAELIHRLSVIPQNDRVIAEVIGREKYGRLFVRLWGKNVANQPVNINQLMIDDGFAVPWDGTGAKP